MSSWMEEIEKEVKDIMKQIETHPFIKGYIKGDLPKKIFANYLSQDILYCIDYQKCIEKISEKAETEEHRKFFKEYVDSKDSYIEDREKVAKEFGVDNIKEKNIICKNYTEFMINFCKNGNICEALASVFPCHWVYDELGIYMNKDKDFIKDNNPYSVMLTVQEAPTEKRMKFQEICEYYANKYPERKEKMKNIFIKAVEYEYDFFSFPYNNS